MEMKKVVMVTMSSNELREILDYIDNLTSGEDMPSGYVTEAYERSLELRKALDAAEGKKTWM